jgi:transcription elongation factor GreA
MNTLPITAAGAEKLRAELHELKTVMRPRISQAIAEARAHGDLRENAEYTAAREQQSFAEGRILEIEAVLSKIQIIDVTKVKASGKVVFGATVDLINDGSGEKVTYQIVGDAEADIRINKIAISSPIARALIGKTEGDTAEVKAPGGIVAYEIEHVRYV